MQKSKGFTLIELIATVSISVIVGAMTVPSFVSMFEKQTADSSAYTLLHSFQQARTEAITRRQVVTICGSNDGSSCSREWRKNLIIFIDEDKDRNAGPEELITQINFELNKDTVLTKVSLGRAYIEIKPNGAPKQWGNFIYCPSDDNANKLHRRVTWNRVGRPYYGRDTDGNGVVNGTDGSDLNCSALL